jgi:hypothetical protein
MEKNSYTNSRLRKVINVYQQQFRDFKAPGFGDYVRGCFHMLQVLRILNTYCKTNVTFDMDIRNHPMSKYIETAAIEPCRNYSTLTNYFIDSLEVKNDPNDIGFQFILNNVIQFFNKIQEETYFTFCCKFPVFEKIEEEDKEFIRQRLLPNEILVKHIEQTLQDLNLERGRYSVIHIRIRDEVSFPPVSLADSRMKDMERLILPKLKPDQKYLLITNHNDIKRYFEKTFISKMSNICHVGQDDAPTDDAVRDTMMDFFLMAYSNSIIAYSEYGFTGFSLECSKLFNIPYEIIPLST